VRHRGRWVGVDSRLPNHLFEAGLASRALAPFARATGWRREVPFGPGRVDFVLHEAGRLRLVEVKSCNKVERGIALFPDAPTTRGARHLETLARAGRRGVRGSVVWVVQRSDASRLRLDRAADPEFAEAAARAAAAGVKLYAYACRVGPRAIAVLRPIPVEVERPHQRPRRRSRRTEAR